MVVFCASGYYTSPLLTLDYTYINVHSYVSCHLCPSPSVTYLLLVSDYTFSLLHSFLFRLFTSSPLSFFLPLSSSSSFPQFKYLFFPLSSFLFSVAPFKVEIFDIQNPHLTLVKMDSLSDRSLKSVFRNASKSLSEGNFIQSFVLPFQ